MNGVLIVGIIACLVFCIGLGFGLLTLQREIEALQIELGNLLNVDNLTDWADVAHERDDEFNERINTVAESVTDLKREFATVKRAVYGTADETEFCRLKTAVLETLPKRIEAIEDLIDDGSPFDVEPLELEIDEEQLEKLKTVIMPFAITEVKETTDGI